MSALSELSPDGMATFATGGLEASAGAAAADGLRVQAPSRGAVDGRGGMDDMSRAPGSLTHVDGTGRASMVDVSLKRETLRSATASARVLLGREAFEAVAANTLAKGDVLATARLAGIGGAKQTSALIPLCHQLSLSDVGVELRLCEEDAAVDIEATARTRGPTGVEMEALTAASVAALTVYDMVRAQL